MATPEWNGIDQFSETFPVYNCAFLDILGYKLKAQEYFDQRYNLYARINRALTTVAVAQALTTPLLGTSELTLEIISDSIIMLQPARQRGLGALLPFACQFASNLGIEGLFLRGGIARGRHCRRKTEQGFDFLASEALQKAYLLESQKAVTPRVLIDSDLMDDLPSEEKQLIIRENGEFILDFAHYVINRGGSNFSDVHAEMTDLWAEVNRQTCDKIKAKLQWILDYYCWTINQNPNWDVAAFRVFNSGKDRRFARLE